MAHALAANAAVGDFDATAVTNHALVFHAPVFAACTFPVLFRAENALAEEAVFFRSIGAIITRFRLLDFAEGPAANVMGASQANTHRPIIVNPVVAAFTGAHSFLLLPSLLVCRDQRPTRTLKNHPLNRCHPPPTGTRARLDSF